MVITIAPKTEAIIQGLVESGRFRDGGEVINQAVQLLMEHEEELRLIESVAEGFAQIERGEGVYLTDELREEMLQSAIRRARAGETPNRDVCP